MLLLALLVKIINKPRADNPARQERRTLRVKLIRSRCLSLDITHDCAYRIVCGVKLYGWANGRASCSNSGLINEMQYIARETRRRWSKIVTSTRCAPEREYIEQIDAYTLKTSRTLGVMEREREPRSIRYIDRRINWRWMTYCSAISSATTARKFDERFDNQFINSLTRGSPFLSQLRSNNLSTGESRNIVRGEGNGYCLYSDIRSRARDVTWITERKPMKSIFRVTHFLQHDSYESAPAVDVFLYQPFSWKAISHECPSAWIIHVTKSIFGNNREWPLINAQSCKSERLIQSQLVQVAERIANLCAG